MTVKFHEVSRTVGLAALISKPRANLTRFQDASAPRSKCRAQQTKAAREKGNQPKPTGEGQAPTPAERRASMTWAQRSKPIFGIDIETCQACGGALKVIACIEDPAAVEKMFSS
ncbi:MAG TPA: hypothetical protein VGB36_13100 [Gammaproteobacteria bacterium]